MCPRISWLGLSSDHHRYRVFIAGIDWWRSWQATYRSQSQRPSSYRLAAMAERWSTRHATLPARFNDRICGACQEVSNCRLLIVLLLMSLIILKKIETPWLQKATTCLIMTMAYHLVDYSAFKFSNMLFTYTQTLNGSLQPLSEYFSL